MSAFIITNKSINNIVNCFYWKKQNEFLKGKVKDKFGLSFDSWKDEENDEELRKFGQLLVDLNFNSVNQRYNDKTKPFKFEFSRVKPSNIYQFLKSVECLAYQSCEGDCEETEIYKFLIELEDSLRSEIVGEIKKYKEAKWE